MGKQEDASRKRQKRNKVRRIILETIKTAGIITIALTVPNVIGAMVKVGLLPHPRQSELVRRSVDRMYAQGLLKHRGGKLVLTERGERTLRKLQLRAFGVQRPRKWDGKWRVLIFDIPEDRRALRDEIRRTLLANGFLRVQDSVWIYPYDCEDWVQLWKAELKVGKELLYLIVDSVENDSLLRIQFGL